MQQELDDFETYYSLGQARKVKLARVPEAEPALPHQEKPKKPAERGDPPPFHDDLAEMRMTALERTSTRSCARASALPRCGGGWANRGSVSWSRGNATGLLPRFIAPPSTSVTDRTNRSHADLTSCTPFFVVVVEVEALVSKCGVSLMLLDTVRKLWFRYLTVRKNQNANIKKYLQRLARQRTYSGKLLRT